MTAGNSSRKEVKSTKIATLLASAIILTILAGPIGGIMNKSASAVTTFANGDVFDAAGNAYVSSVGGNGITKFDSAGIFVQNFAVGRVDWMDLSADQCTMLYTLEGDSIKRHDVCTDTAMTDFASGLARAFALRI